MKNFRFYVCEPYNHIPDFPELGFDEVDVINLSKQS